MIIGKIYQPPRDIVENYTEFTEEFTTILNEFSIPNSNCLKGKWVLNVFLFL